MTPSFKSDSCHKYDTIDYYEIDPSFGTKEDLKELVQKAHDRGMKVVMDAVFNHTGKEFFAFKDILEKGEKSKYLDWYYIDELIYIYSCLSRRYSYHTMETTADIFSPCPDIHCPDVYFFQFFSIL